MSFPLFFSGGGFTVQPLPVSVGGFTDANYLTFTGLNAGLDLGVSHSLVIVWDPQQATDPVGNALVIGYSRGNFGTGGSRGWLLFNWPDGRILLEYRPSDLSDSFAWFDKIPGTPTRLALTITAGNQIRASVAGNAPIATAGIAYVAGDGTTEFVVGRGNSGSPGSPFTLAGFAAFAIFNRMLSDAELMAASAGTGWTIPLASDPNCTVDWDAQRDYPVGATSTTSRGTSPVTLTVAGAPSRAKIVQLNTRTPVLGMTPVGSLPVVIDPTFGFQVTSPFAYYEITTKAADIFVEYYAPIEAAAPQFAQIGVLANSVYKGTITQVYPLVEEKRIGYVNVGGAGTLKTVRVVCGGQFGARGVGTFPNAIWTPNAYPITPVTYVAPAEQLNVLGDSIANGGTTTTPQTEAWTMLVRADFPGNTAVTGWAGRSFADSYSVDPTMATLAAEVVALGDGTVRTTEYIVLGMNDWFGSAWPGAVFAQFQPMVLALLQKIRLLRPAARIKVQGLSTVTAATNGAGQTPTIFSSAMQAAVVAFADANCTYADASAWLNPATQVVGTVHPNVSGHQTMHTNIKTFLGY